MSWSGRGGHDLFVAFWGKRDVAMVKGPEFRKIAETYKRLRDYVDPGSPGATGTMRPAW